MAPVHFRVQLDRSTRRRLLIAVLLLNVSFTVTTGVFIFLWSRMDVLTPPLQRFTRYVLVQGHLATENVAAAWYTSMLLLGVAGLAALAWAADHRRGEGMLRHGWLLFAIVFATLSIDEIGSLHERIGMIPVFSERAVGWVYLLGIPIIAVAAFLISFAWLHVRRVPAAFALIALGVLLFLAVPVLEAIEMHLIHGTGALLGTPQRTLHDILLVVEEGGLELTGILCFAAGVWIYTVGLGGEAFEWSLERSRVLTASWVIAGLLAAGVLASGRASDLLPAGDTGILENWFPACAWALVALVAVTHVDARLTHRVVVTACALALSLCLGAGLYIYSGWLASRASWVTQVAAVLGAGLTLEVLLNPYLFRRSPRSSIASPTLRRPRPKPS